MRVTSPPKYHKQPHKSKSPFKTQPKKSINNQQPIIHHLRSPSKILTKTQTKNSIKQNLYAQLKNRQHQYVELIKDLHQQNKNLKQQIVKMQHQQSHQFIRQPIHLSPGRMSLNQTLNNTNSGYKVFKTMDNQKMMNKTFSNFTSPPKIIETHNNDHHKILTNRSPFSKKPCIMSNTSPDGFRPATSVRNNSPCIRPFSNLNINTYAPQSTRTQIRTVNHSYQPSIMSYNPSKNQSLQPSPKKNLQIIHVLNTAVKTTSPSPNKIVFKQTDDSKQNNQSHLNPLTSKRHRQNKSVRFQSPQKQRQIQAQLQKQENVDLDKKIEQNPLLSMLKQRLQQGDFLNGQIKQKNIQQSQCLEFIKPSEYNHNIRYSFEGVKKQTIQPTHIIHPLKRNLLEGFPILNQLRMANSQYEQENQIPVRQQPVQVQNIVSQNNYKTKDSFNVKSQISKQSRLSAKISKQSESKSLIQQPPNRTKQLTIIKMLEQNLNQSSQSQNFIGHTNFESHQSIQSQTNIHKQQQNYSVNFIKRQKESIQNIIQINNDNQIQYEKKDKLKFEQQQHLVRPANFSNRFYCQQTEQNISIQSQKSIQQNIQKSIQQNNYQEQKSIKKPSKKVQINEDKNMSKVLPSKKVINSSQQSLHFDQPSKQQKFFQLKSQPKDQSIQLAQDQQSIYQNSFVKEHTKMNQNSKHHLTYINNKDDDKLNSSFSSQLNKTSPNPFYPQKQMLQSKNKKYVDTHSLTSNQYPSSSTLRSQKFKKITNQAYL